MDINVILALVVVEEEVRELRKDLTDDEGLACNLQPATCNLELERGLDR